MARTNQDDEKFRELIVFYVNGTLENDEHVFVEDYLRAYPEMNTYLEFNQKLMRAIQGEDEDFEYNGSAMRARLNDYLKSKKQRRIDLLDRLFGTGFNQRFVDGLLSWGFSPALGVVCALMIGQSIYLVNLQNEASKYRGIVNSVNIAPHFKVTVSPKADFYDLADLLRKNGCNVVSGPSQNGELWVKLDEPAKSKQIKTDLLNSGLVDEVISVSPAVE